MGKAYKAFGEKFKSFRVHARNGWRLVTMKWHAKGFGKGGHLHWKVTANVKA